VIRAGSCCFRETAAGGGASLLVIMDNWGNLVTPVWLLYAELSALHKKRKKRRPK